MSAPSRSGGGGRILQSPFLNLTIVDRALEEQTDPNERIKLLSAKIHLLTNTATSSTNSSRLSHQSNSILSIHGTSRPSPDPATRLPPSGSGSNQVGNSSHGPLHSGHGSRSDVFDNKARSNDWLRASLPHQMKVLGVRLDLARTLMTVVPPRLTEAEAELTTIEGDCKRLLKRLRRPKDRDKGLVEAREDAGLTENEVEREEEVERKLAWIRVDGLKLLVEVEEGLGREGRAKRWMELIRDLQSQDNG